MDHMALRLPPRTLWTIAEAGRDGEALPIRRGALGVSKAVGGASRKLVLAKKGTEVVKGYQAVGRLFAQ